MTNHLTRRHFLRKVSAGAAGLGLARGAVSAPAVRASSAADKLAILGGKAVRTEPFPSWPLIKDNDEKTWMEVLRSRDWCRAFDGHYATRFEETWARTLGAKYCVATSCGTSALYASLNALEVGPGDEVILPPYTFVATLNVILMQYALPVFIDSDRETSQIDAGKIEAKITPRTRCIMPVHLGGNPANMDMILEVAKKHKIPVIEDACQAHTGEWRNRRVSTLGDLGCFSFQASKNLNSGEGGAILTNDSGLHEFCKSFQNQGRAPANTAFGYARQGSNLRITEFQAALLLQQITRLEEQSRLREQNAEYLTSMLREIPGISPARMYEGATRNGYHLYMLRYHKAHFSELPRARFLEALEKEGIPCAGGYTPLNKEPFLKQTLNSRAFRSVYSERDLADLDARNECLENDRLCEEAVWFFQTMLLGSRQDMEQIAEAIRKIQKHSGQLVRGYT
ncbi:MAG: DegT/DnrJ/EryC1/StrS family aminotransferase [Acidobacteriia bacterium]|nr:DegT/DnrJ/EryC1/StrS family aminotransferase [Terriglobia bacterium]